MNIYQKNLPHNQITANSTLIEVSSFQTQEASIDFGKLFQQYNNPQGWMMIGGILLVILLLQISSTGKGKITTGKVCGVSEKLAATNLALKQIKEHKHNKVTLWSGTPRYWVKGKWRGLLANIQTMLGAAPTVWFLNAERGTLVIGAPGSGKTYSTIDRMLESAMQQGFPILLYDKKGDQLRLHAPLAARYGYKVRVFAPGEPFSGVINPLDYMRDARDGVMAGEIGQVINRNASSGGKSDEFFAKAGDLLAKALLQLVKGSPYPDMAMLYAVLRLPKLVQRLDHAVQSKRLDEWVATSFVQFLSAKDAEKTISGILTTAAGTFSSFIQADLLRAFMGKSDIPTKLEGREMVVFKLDDERRSVVGPLLAAAMHLMIVGNLSRPRKDPLIISLDELPSIKLDRLPQWINEYRSNGACFILGIQSLEQLYDIYGDKMGSAIASACSTHVLFNPGNYKTAEDYSKRYGEKEVLIKNRTTGRSLGGQMSRSISWSENLQKMPVISADEILKFPQGKCVITSPGYSSEGQASIPYPLIIPVSKADEKRAHDSEALWDTQVKPALESQVIIPDIKTLTQALHERIESAARMLPLPEEDVAPAQESNSSEPDVLENFTKRVYQTPGLH
ncbi:MAG: type IV secretory system conjugative DNA transfer family protein [Nostoc sp. EkiNYC01]|nr:type IV secretion system DNA-binding domain-containing protein [Nostoc sp. EkiNYC01]